MIKVGCNYLSLPELDLESFIKTAHDLELDVIDFHRRAFTSTEPDYLLRIRRLCLDLGLPMGYLGVSAGFTGDDTERQKQVEACKEAIDLAAFVGTPLIRIFGGPLRPDSRSRDSVFAALAQSVRQIAEYGAANGVVVALQNHDNNNIAATPEDCIRILTETNHPNFSFILDTGQWAGSIGVHPHDGEFDPDVDIYAYIEQMLPYASYVRTKFYRIESGREEWLDYRRILGILKTGGYNGNLSIVYEGQEEDRVEAVRKAALHLRNLLGEGA